jgi:hypothetical protein
MVRHRLRTEIAHTGADQMTIETQNEGYGFFGAIGNQGIDGNEAWDLAFTIIKLATNESEKGVRDFLDSRLGRHFAEDVFEAYRASSRSKLNLTNAIVTAGFKWKGSKVGKNSEGIPRDLNYLQGWVSHFATQAEA